MQVKSKRKERLPLAHCVRYSIGTFSLCAVQAKVGYACGGTLSVNNDFLTAIERRLVGSEGWSFCCFGGRCQHLREKVCDDTASLSGGTIARH